MTTTARQGHMDSKQRILRTWKGWTTIENAKVYEDMLRNEVFPEIKRKGVAGLEKVTISTLTKETEVEFLLILQFDSLESVKSFAGEDYRAAYIPENAQRVLLRYDKTAQHFEFKQELVFD
jgi:hypothetical protein